MARKRVRSRRPTLPLIFEGGCLMEDAHSTITDNDIEFHRLLGSVDSQISAITLQVS